jgi:hypothetical protein
MAAQLVTGRHNRPIAQIDRAPKNHDLKRCPQAGFQGYERIDAWSGGGWSEDDAPSAAGNLVGGPEASAKTQTERRGDAAESTIALAGLGLVTFQVEVVRG